MFNPVINGIKEHVREQTKEAIFGAAGGLMDVIVESAYSIALIGGGLSILFYVAGWNKGKRITGILVLGYTLIKLLLG